jgi:hypothetical protein
MLVAAEFAPSENPVEIAVQDTVVPEVITANAPV